MINIKKLNSIFIASILSLVFQPVFSQSFNGKTEWMNTVDISSITSSSIHKIHVKEGQVVNKGDLLISMDSVALELDFKIAQSQLSALAPDKELADMDLNRAYELYDRTLLSDVELKTAEFKLTQSKAKYEVAKEVKDRAEFLLNSAKIKSPINGRVISIHKSVGFFSNNDNALTLITIVPVNEMNAVAYLKVSQWNQALVGKKATVSLKNKTYNGIVNSLGFRPIKNAKGLSVYPISIRFRPNEALPSGMPLIIEIK